MDAYVYISLDPNTEGKAHGHRHWEHALRHLRDVNCVGLQAASHSVTNGAEWGFKTSSQTIRRQLLNAEDGLSAQAVSRSARSQYCKRP